MQQSDSDRAAIAAVLELFEDDPEAVDELVTAAIGTLAESVTRIKRAAASGDHDELARAAHRLKGAAGSIGGKELSAISAGIERAARAGTAVDAATVRRCANAAAALDADLRSFLTAPLAADRSHIG